MEASASEFVTSDEEVEPVEAEPVEALVLSERARPVEHLEAEAEPEPDAED
jgi:hypothetical protein